MRRIEGIRISANIGDRLDSGIIGQPSEPRPATSGLFAFVRARRVIRARASVSWCLSPSRSSRSARDSRFARSLVRCSASDPTCGASLRVVSFFFLFSKLFFLPRLPPLSSRFETDAMSSLKDDKPPCARLCHIVKWDDFPGYGFNLHAQKGKNGQFIGKVDDGSPSQAAGLRQGDRIIEVNEIDIANETHNQVVERIKAFANETKLLVVDQEADDYFRENNIVIKGTMPNIKVIKTPERNPNSVEDRSDGSNHSVDEVSDSLLLSVS